MNVCSIAKIIILVNMVNVLYAPTTYYLPTTTMKLSVWLYTMQAALAVLQAARDLLEEAKTEISKLPPKYHGVNPLYTQNNIDAGVYIPQYDWTAQQYVGHVTQPPPDVVTDQILPKLEAAALQGLSEASAMLGDIYTFGNFSVAANYSRAAAYYHDAVSEQANAHAYYMLGFFYSTGMFGQIPTDSDRANVYYEFAAQNGDYSALLTLAHRHSLGIGRPQDCLVAQFYYSRAARVVMHHLQQSGAEPAYENVLHNIKIPDFNGGLYGPHLTESDLSVILKVDRYIATRNALREGNLNTHDAELADYYFDAHLHYYGGHFLPQNMTRAFEEAIMCAYVGEKKLGHRRGRLLSDIDKYVWSRCMSLLGHMYVKGHGVERNLERAYVWMERTAALDTNERDMLDRALLHQFDPVTDGVLSTQYVEWLGNAFRNGSTHAAYLYARYLSGSREREFDTTYEVETYQLFRRTATRGHYESLFYVADAVEAGFAASLGESFTCPDVVNYYKRFVERSDSFALPQLQYAFDEFIHGNYNAALLGYLMAAEQGVSNAQVSAAYLLFQMDPLFTWKPRTFALQRVNAAITYLELASLQGDVDATILLGDLYSGGAPGANVTCDHAKAFAYYNKAALAASPHACYKLGYMYEYGLGSANNTVDYYMAKRYYDFSIKYRQERSAMTKGAKRALETYALSIALLRLRLKMLWKNDRREPPESSGWLGTLQNLQSTVEADDDDLDRAQAHHEGTAFDDDVDQEYDTFDYVVLFSTFCFFVFLVIQNVQRQVRRMRGNGNGNENRENQNGNDDGDNQNADNNAAANNAIRLQGRNFEFFFFAI